MMIVLTPAIDAEGRDLSTKKQADVQLAQMNAQAKTQVAREREEVFAYMMGNAPLPAWAAPPARKVRKARDVQKVSHPFHTLLARGDRIIERIMFWSAFPVVGGFIAGLLADRLDRISAAIESSP